MTGSPWQWLAPHDGLGHASVVPPVTGTVEETPAVASG